MHACGHDGHTGDAARRGQAPLQAPQLRRHRLPLIFQPAEEGGGGAREMMNDGLFEKFPMEAIFGAHNWPGLKAGQFALGRGRRSRRATSSW
jgi:Metal-dependent amidase/aminoacylase/carboxypeptidase